jgi:hypothetical protein
LRAWLDGVEQTELPPALGHEVGRWSDQVKHEVGLCRAALRIIERLDGGRKARASEEALGLAYLWPGMRRAEATVMGARCSFRPVISQADDGTWQYRQGSVQEDANATDALVRYALQLVADANER